MQTFDLIVFSRNRSLWNILNAFNSSIDRSVDFCITLYWTLCRENNNSKEKCSKRSKVAICMVASVHISTRKFTGMPLELKERKISAKRPQLLKTPNWREADQLIIYNHAGPNSWTRFCGATTPFNWSERDLNGTWTCPQWDITL